MKTKTFSLRVEDNLLGKLHFVAKHENRSANGEILALIRKHIAAFEKEHGPITIEENTI